LFFFTDRRVSLVWKLLNFSLTSTCICSIIALLAKRLSFKKITKLF